MSDDDDYEYGAYFDSDDDYREDIADHVNSLAEHTCYSPVLVNAHPDFDIDYDDWEYLTDEYWDGEADATIKAKASENSDTQSSGKRKRSDQEAPGSHEKPKRRRITPKPEQIFHHQAVVWKSKAEDSESSVPILRSGDGEKVTVLENWRELLGGSDKEDKETPSAGSEENKAKSHGKARSSPKAQSSKKKAVEDVSKASKAEKKKDTATKAKRVSTRSKK